MGIYQTKKGGEIGMGNTCKSMADSFQCMTKPTTIKKKKLLFSKGNHQQNEKATYGMGENVYKLHI